MGRQRQVLVGAAAVGAAAAVAARARRSSPSAFLTSERRVRNLQAARLAASLGGGAAVHRARSVFASAARREELNAELELRSAQQVAATLGQMKGALMKVGQLASFVDDGMPEPVRQALSQLQQDVPPTVPPAFVILQRINLGLIALLGRLNATRNWRRIAEELWPFCDAPPSTPLGEKEAEWWEHHGATRAAGFARPRAAG